MFSLTYTTSREQHIAKYKVCLQLDGGNSDHNFPNSIYNKLSIIRKNYYMKIYTDETKVSFAKSENPVRIKRVANKRRL
jgi:hypothetical protein